MTPLDEILIGYPSFQANQLLSSEDLNSLADYLEQQDRHTRQRLIGIGVACGLVPDLPAASRAVRVTVTEGVGVTSEGYLAYLEGRNCTHRRPFVNEAAYEPFEGIVDSIIEIMEDPGETNDETIEELSGEDVDEKVVVLYLDKRERDTDKCLDDDCDEKGKRWEITTRILLVSVEAMEEVIETLEEVDVPLPEHYHPEYGLPMVSIERFGHTASGGGLDLAGIHRFEDFRGAYERCIRQGGRDLANALHRVYELYGPLFAAQLETPVNPFPGFEDPNADANPLVERLVEAIEDREIGVQYVYDLVRDLAATYEELRAALFDLTGRCCPPTGWFPCHLMLGRLRDRRVATFDPAEYDPPDVFRHAFIPSPIHDGQSNLLLRIKQLVQRLVLMLDRFVLDGRLPDERGIRITPSRSCREPLGRCAIPFYYDVAGGGRKLHDHWSFEAAIRGESKRLQSYRAEEYAGDVPAVVAPLRFDVCDRDVLRIEGQVGMQLGEAVRKLQDLRKRYNLDFDILTLKLDSTFDSVYLADDTKIADLQSRYLVERNEVVCCVRDTIRALEDHGEAAAKAVRDFLRLMDKERLFQLYVRFYGLYVEALRDLLEQLPLDLKDFELFEFQEAYELAHAMSRFAKYVLDMIGEVDPMPDREEARYLRRAVLRILNRIELFLDPLLDDCLLARFETLHGLFVDRVRKTATFSGFNESVHGMEHIAGCGRGGTFILVYDDPSERQTVTGHVVDMDGNPLVGATVTADHVRKAIEVVTDDLGRFEVEAPESVNDLYFRKAGYYRKKGDIGDKNVIKIKLKSYSQVQLDRYKNDVSSAVDSRADVSNMEDLSSEEAAAASIRDVQNTEFRALLNKAHAAGMASASALGVFAEKGRITLHRNLRFVDDEDFRVVGDFFLPATLPSYELEGKLEEVCPLDGRKGVDFERLLKEFQESIGNETGFANPGSVQDVIA